MPAPDPPKAPDLLSNPLSVEINAVEHCNLRCAGCSHLSPVMAKWRADPVVVHADLTALAKVYRAGFVKLVGGEPLLHPALTELLIAIREAGVSRKVSICTNGLLLPRMSPDVWDLIDHIQISCYPGSGYERLDLASVEATAAERGVTTRIVQYKTFRVPYLEAATLDPALARRVFKTCKIAHHWKCHTAHQGVFYRCAPALFLGKDAGRASADDGVPIHSGGDLRERLGAYLASREPLTACSTCLGTAGRRFSHRQTTRRAWREGQRGTVSDLIDFDRLSEDERLLDAAS